MTNSPLHSKPDVQLHVVMCGSMSALAEMESLADKLRQNGFRVTTPAPEERSLDWKMLDLEGAVARKREFLNDYFDVIRQGDIVLIANYRKHGVDGYIGANSLMEAACGHALGKPVVFLNSIGDQPCQLEARAIAMGILKKLIRSRCLPFLQIREVADEPHRTDDRLSPP
ncbi:MAG: hypothetical protein K5905_15270 [Roseibium sp.]|uniref:hypothetical protein n=1 Tax=Roseibium sp. TaxID=1936156 RepID=UPI0026198401|nr:hypothetical protein [Roseibium sp.]MCV0426820.1 hypothetical protein [Roseibium sp.]